MLKKIFFLLIRIIKSIYYKKIFGSFGEKSYIKGKIWLSSPKNIFIGKKCKIGPYCRLETFPNYAKIKSSARLVIENNCSLQHAVHIYCASEVILKEGCLIASGCLITDENHGTNPEINFYENQPLISKKVILNKGVWLGENVCVLPGSEIGEKSIIGANSVVNGIIPSYSIAVGSPAKVIKKYNFENKTWEKV